MTDIVLDLTKLSIQEMKHAMYSHGKIPEGGVDWLFRHYNRRLNPEPKGFYTTAELSKVLISGSIISFRDRTHPLGYAGFMSCHYLSQDPHFPLYHLDPELLEDLLLTDPPTELRAKMMLPPHGCIILPRNQLQTQNGSVVAITFKIFQKGEKPQGFAQSINGKTINWGLEFETQDTIHLCWASWEDHGHYMGGITSITHQEQGVYKLVHDGVTHEPGANEDLARAEQDIARIHGILVSALMFADMYPAEQREALIKIVKPKRKKNANPTPIYRPLFIGQGYKSVARAHRRSQTQGQKKPHWRRGHWRRVAYGKGRSQRRWKLIPLTYVNAGL